MYSMSTVSRHPGGPFVFIFLMAYSMHNDLSWRIQYLLLEDHTKQCHRSVLLPHGDEDGIFQSPYRLEISACESTVGGESPRGLAFMLQHPDYTDLTLNTECDRQPNGWGQLKQWACRSGRVTRDLAKHRAAITVRARCFFRASEISACECILSAFGC